MLAAGRGGHTWYKKIAGEIRASTIRELTSVSQLVSSELVQWRIERIGDGVVMGHDASIAALVDAAILRPGAPARDALRTRLQAHYAYGQYDAFLIVSRDGGTVLREPASTTPLPDGADRDIRRIIRRGRPDLLDFYRSESGNRTHLALVVPAGGGALVLRIDPNAFIHPLLETWPGKSATAETQLLRRDGADALFLSDLRFSPDAALRQRIPLDRRNVLAVRAVLGATGVAEGVDYSGQPSIGVLRAVPNSPWFLVARIQTSETDAEARRWFWSILVSVGLIIVSAGLALVAIGLSQQTRYGAKESALVAVLQENEERLRLSMIAAELMPWELNADTGAIVSVPEYARALGLDPVTFSDSLERWAERLHPDDRDLARARFSALMSGESSQYRGEYRQRTADGSWKWFSSIGAVMARHPDGRPRRVVGTRADITERKALELARAEAEAAREHTSMALHELLRTSPTIVYQMREVLGQLAPVEVSENITRLTGYTIEEVLAPGWWTAAILPEDLPHAIATVDRVAAEDTVSHEFRFRTKDGRILWMQDQLSVVMREEGRPVEVTGSWSDVTARHEADALLRESEQRLRLALKATRQGLIDIDVATGAAVVSREYAELHGQDPATFVETAEAWASRLHPDDRTRAVGAFAAYLAGKTDTYRTEVRQQVGSEWRWILTHGEIAERHPDGTPKRFIGTATDITDLKTAQLQAQSSAQLYAALSLCNEAIVRCRNESELFPLICQAAVQSGAATMAWIGIVDPGTALLNKVARYGKGVEYLDRIEISVSAESPLGRGPTGTSVRENRPCWISKFQQAQVTALWHDAASAFGWRASAALPLRRNGNAIGALTLYSTTADEFSEVDRQLLTQMADDITFALDSLASERERLAMERALQQSEHRYRTLFQESRVSLLLIDPESGAIVDANAAAAALYGWPETLLRGMNIAEINTLTPGEIKEQMALAHSAGHRHFDFRHRTAAGPILDVEVYSGDVRLNDRDLLLSTVIDVTERKRAQERLQVSEASLRDSLREKEALLKEVHHRVKNNLQVINSLMRLEAGRSTDPAVKAVLGIMQNRILSMAVLHETLYRSSNLARIDLGGYLTQLAHQVVRTMTITHVALELDMAPVLVDIEQAVPCGLLANELLSNALKHGFPERRTGVIRMSLQPDPAGRGVVLDISDNGVGLPGDWEEKRQSSLGLQLVTDLTRQLLGTMTIQATPGARFTLRFTPQASREGVV